VRQFEQDLVEMPLAIEHKLIELVLREERTCQLHSIHCGLPQQMAVNQTNP
jgi:hypothetical protein